MFPEHINESVFNDFKAPITCDHIAQGERRDANRCAVAIALNEKFEERKEVFGHLCIANVASSVIYIGYSPLILKNYHTAIRTTGLLNEYIEAFDTADPMPEGELYIQPRTIDNDGNLTLKFEEVLSG